MNQTLGQIYASQLESEARATRQCLERITEDSLSFKPVESSMPMKSLAITLSEIPRWISLIVEGPEIEFATYKGFEMKSVADLAPHFDETLAGALKALQGVSDEELAKDFALKHNGQVLSTDSKKNSIDQSIRHLVHHRGQLTVYMRMCGIAVPKIYGPSGDEKSW